MTSRELTRPPTAYVEDEGEWLLEADTAGDDE
jgi:hypothetical protein